MKEFVDKLIGRLEDKELTSAEAKAEAIIGMQGVSINYYSGELEAYGRAIRIVKELAEEYNNGWIPCSERLPEIDGCTSDTVLVCCSNGFQYMAFWCDDLQWRFCECGTAKEPIIWTEIIAWQSLPIPYKAGDSDELS